MTRSAAWHANWHLRLLFMGIMMAAAFGVLTWRLWLVQVRDCPLYTSRLASRSEIRVRVPPVRGEIRDRNGLLLAENCASFDIEFYLPEMVRAYRELYGSVPMLSYEGHVHEMAKMLHEPDIVEIVDTAVAPIPHRKSRTRWTSRPSTACARICSICRASGPARHSSS